MNDFNFYEEIRTKVIRSISTIEGQDGACFFADVLTDERIGRIEKHHDNMGEYAIDWYVVIYKNGDVRKINAKNVESVEYSDPTVKETDTAIVKNADCKECLHRTCNEAIETCDKGHFKTRPVKQVLPLVTCEDYDPFPF